MTIVEGTKTMVPKPATIFRMTGTMVFVANTIVLAIGTIVFVTMTIVETTETTVMVAKNMVLVAKTMAYKVLTIVFLIVEQSFANSSWLFLELAARSQHYCCRKYYQQLVEHHQYTIFVLQRCCQSFLSAVSGKPATRSNAGGRFCLLHFLHAVYRSL
jgi:hypothetical protein